jgi:outer membrane protein TolC
VGIEATDNLPEPRPDDIPDLQEALREARKNRPELEQAELNLRNQDITIQSVRSRLLPTLDIFATYAPTGLAGNQQICVSPTGPTSCFIPGGISQALTQVLHGRYPDYSFGATFQLPIRNRTAQADAATAMVQERQQRAQLQRIINQAEQEVRNAVIAVTQAKAQIDAAAKAAVLAQQTLDAEQKKFKLGESTVFLVIQAERDLVAAQGNEVKARQTYAQAITQYQQATATILARYRVEMSDALGGQVTRAPNIPGTPQQPASEKPLSPGR